MKGKPGYDMIILSIRRGRFVMRFVMRSPHDMNIHIGLRSTAFALIDMLRICS
jgi:hypothetical protein